MNSARIWMGFFALVALPCWIIVDTAIALLRGWSLPVDTTTQAIYQSGRLVLAGLVFAAFVCLLWRPGRRFLSRSGHGLLLALVASVTYWLIAEAVLGVLDLELRQTHRNLPNQTRTYRPNPKWVPGVAGESRWTTNSQGVRGPEFPPREEAHRILCIGASTTANIFLDDEETWSRLLMVALNERDLPRRYWVGDVGMPGFPTWLQLMFYEKSPLMEEVDTVFALIGAADYFGALRNGPRKNNWRAPPLWARSYAFGATRKALLHYVRDESEVHTPRGELYQTARVARRRAVFSDEQPDLSQPLSNYVRNVHELIAAARRRGVRPIFATQPYMWRDGLSRRSQNLLWFGRLEDGTFLTMQKLRKGMDRYNLALMQICAEEQVDCVDLSTMNGNEQYFYDDVHFTEAGAAQVARLIADYLSTPLLVRSGTPRTTTPQT